MDTPFNPFGNNTTWTAIAGDPITVLIGASETPFTIHEKQLRANSAFFDAALGKEWKEQGAHAVRLPEEQPFFFDIYVHWLYRGVINQAVGNFKLKFMAFAALYNMGSRLQDLDFQDAAIDAFIWLSEEERVTPGDAAINAIYANTMPGDRARRLLVDLVVEENTPQLYTERFKGLTIDFFCDLANKYAAVLSGEQEKPVVREANQTCMYHGHGDKPCYRVAHPGAGGG